MDWTELNWTERCEQSSVIETETKKKKKKKKNKKRRLLLLLFINNILNTERTETSLVLSSFIT
jgi:hypothetical protein